jgi:hypothetical protein
MKILAASLLVSVQLLGDPPKIEIPDWENAVRLELVASQDKVRPGDTFELAVVAEIQPGYHLYGPEEPEPTRTKVALVGDTLKSGDPLYPAPIRRDLSGLGEYDLYEGKIAIRIPVSLPKAPAGTVDASVKVNYQICTDFACSAPTSDVLSVKVPGAQPGSAVRALHPEIFSKKQAKP